MKKTGILKTMAVAISITLLSGCAATEAPAEEKKLVIGINQLVEIGRASCRETV